jgi:hypothetical protein
MSISLRVCLAGAVAGACCAGPRAAAADKFTVTDATSPAAVAAKADSTVVTALASRTLHLEVNAGILAASVIATAQGFYGGYSDPFTSNSLATAQNAHYDEGTDTYGTQTPGTVQQIPSDLTPTVQHDPDGGGYHTDMHRVSDNGTVSSLFLNDGVKTTDDLTKIVTLGANGVETTGWPYRPAKVTWDFGAGNEKVFTTVKWIGGKVSRAAEANGWQIRASNDGSTFTMLYGNSTDSGDYYYSGSADFENTTAYRYWQLYCKYTGNQTNYFFGEIELMGAQTQAITLVSSAWAMGFTPTSCLWQALVEFVAGGGATVADISAYASFDNSTWAQATLTDGGATGSGTYHVVYGSVVPGGTPGTNVYWKAITVAKPMRFKWGGVPASQE